jgi:aminoglycoside 3-N-acetyltransferase
LDKLTAKLISDLIKLGIKKGGILLVHSSLRSLGNYPNKAGLIINSLLEVLGEEGTLLMPALTFETVHADNPFFDIDETHSCVGALTEIFRKSYKTMRSLHPTHSVCGLGKMAEDILKDHYLDRTPCGPHSPYYKLKAAGGQILFIGCGLKPNTSMHAVEELVNPPYLFGEEVIFYLTYPQSQMKMKMRTHYFKGWKQRYDRLENILTSPEITKGKILEADSYLIDTPAMWKKAHDVLLKNPFYFVDKIE